jgi:hypothetical protein
MDPYGQKWMTIKEDVSLKKCKNVLTKCLPSNKYNME